MDIAYDHIQEEVIATEAETPHKKSPAEGSSADEKKESLNSEFQEAYKAISSSPWGAKFGAFMGSVRKQGESYIETSKKEYTQVSTSASKGLSSLVSRTRTLSITGSLPKLGASSGTTAAEKGVEKEGEAKGNEEGLLSRFKKGASQRIAAIEAAEARADELLLRFGRDVGSFLRDAVTIDPPSESELEGQEVLFEAKTDDGKRQIYTTRLDRQLHLLHTNLELFKSDPAIESFVTWSKNFSAEESTELIAKDLERYPELRESMEKLVPDEVIYTDFWSRYYFLRNELDVEEMKRKELLKGATADEEEVGWDEDESDAEVVEKEEKEEEKVKEAVKEEKPKVKETVKEDKEKEEVAKSTETLKPKETSTDRDSEASYDVVSGAPSKAPSQSAGSPPKKVESDSEEEDWE
ncbi:hypothetical protein RUND412_004809 [Rhizina undulata]